MHRCIIGGERRDLVTGGVDLPVGPDVPACIQECVDKTGEGVVAEIGDEPAVAVDADPVVGEEDHHELPGLFGEPAGVPAAFGHVDRRLGPVVAVCNIERGDGRKEVFKAGERLIVGDPVDLVEYT